MVYEFEGRSEKEAIDTAAGELGLERDGFDVEILESQVSSIFKKGKVRIRVHTRDTASEATHRDPVGNPLPADEFEARVLEFTKRMIEGMGYACEVAVLFREEKKLGIRIDSEHASIIIGKKGKNLDALQVLVNVYSGRQGR